MWTGWKFTPPAYQTPLEFATLERGGPAVEEAMRVKNVVAHKLKSAAVKLVGSGFGHDLRDCARALLIQDGGVVLLHLELGDGIQIEIPEMDHAHLSVG